MKQKMSTTESIDLIASIVGEQLDITGEKTRSLAISGALSGITRVFYSRQQCSLKIRKRDGNVRRSQNH